MIMKKDILVTLLMIVFGLICVTGSCLIITFPSFIIFFCVAFYWLTNTKYGGKFIENVCGRN
jgi:hypothetical protein